MKMSDKGVLIFQRQMNAIRSIVSFLLLYVCIIFACMSIVSIVSEHIAVLILYDQWGWDVPIETLSTIQWFIFIFTCLVSVFLSYNIAKAKGRKYVEPIPFVVLMTLGFVVGIHSMVMTTAELQIKWLFYGFAILFLGQTFALLLIYRNQIRDVISQ